MLRRVLAAENVSRGQSYHFYIFICRGETFGLEAGEKQREEKQKEEAGKKQKRGRGRGGRKKRQGRSRGRRSRKKEAGKKQGRSREEAEEEGGRKKR